MSQSRSLPPKLNINEFSCISDPEEEGTLYKKRKFIFNNCIFSDVMDSDEGEVAKPSTSSGKGASPSQENQTPDTSREDEKIPSSNVRRKEN